MIKASSGKILFTADLHLGVRQDSHVWHSIALRCAEWMRDVGKEHQIQSIVIAGDVFHDRHKIGVDTLDTADSFLQTLLEVFDVYIIPGNHDSYLSNTTKINSVKLLLNKTSADGKRRVHVFNTPEILEIEGSSNRIGLCPWNTSPQVLTGVDVLVGHFEIANFRYNHSRICEHGEQSTDLLAVAPRVISGHFHYHEKRDYGNNQYITYLGAPYEMDLGDRGHIKGVSILDADTLELTFVENTISPKHHRFDVSKLSEIFTSQETARSLTENNIIRLYVDMPIDALLVDQLASKIQSYKPLQFRVEFDTLEEAAGGIITMDQAERLSIDVQTAFSEFIQLVDLPGSKEDVLKTCLELYQQCLTTND